MKNYEKITRKPEYNSNIDTFAAQDLHREFAENFYDRLHDYRTYHARYNEDLPSLDQYIDMVESSRHEAIERLVMYYDDCFKIMRTLWFEGYTQEALEENPMTSENLSGTAYMAMECFLNGISFDTRLKEILEIDGVDNMVDFTQF